jgi:hypothetical protein
MVNKQVLLLILYVHFDYVYLKITLHIHYSFKLRFKKKHAVIKQKQSDVFRLFILYPVLSFQRINQSGLLLP